MQAENPVLENNCAESYPACGSRAAHRWPRNSADRNPAKL